MDRCVICQGRLKEEDPRTACSHCRQEYHTACWNEVGGCATYGCPSAPVAEKPAPPPSVRTGWGDEKECPVCQATIPSSLLICRRCKTRFPWADPMRPAEYRAWVAAERARTQGASRLLILFLLSLLGWTAPLLGLLAGLYAYSNRRRLSGRHGAYLALGYGTAALGVTYALVFVLLAVGL